MLKKKLTAILTVVIAASVFSTVGLAQTEETKLFEDNFESGLNSEMWNVDSNSGLGNVKSDQEKWITTSSTQDSEFSYEYSAQKEDIAFNVTINATSWKSTGKAFEMYVRYVDANNWFKLAYTPGSSKFELIKCVAREESTIATAEKQLEANKDYKLSLQAKHGVVRFELDGITLIQDYTGIDNFDKTADKNYAKFKTISQELKITALDVNEEDTLLHQQFANTGVIMTQSKTPQQDIVKLGSGYTQESDSISVSGNTGLEFALANEDWVQSNLGTDFSATEATYVLKHEGVSDGAAILHFRTNMSTNGKTTYLAKVTRDGWSLGDNYNANEQSEKVKQDGYGNGWGFRPLTLGEYHTYKVVKVPAADYSYVTVTLYVDGVQKLEWKDEKPAFTANDDGVIIAGGLGFAIVGESKSTAKYSLKSYELRDLNGSNKVMYEETFDNTYNWENANLVTGGGEDNKYYVTTSNNNGVLVVNDKQWKNVVADVDLRFDNTSATSTDNCAGILVRYVDANNYVMGAYSPYGSDGNGTIFIKTVVNGVETEIASKEITAFEQGVSHKLGISIKDGAAILFVDGKTALNAPLKKYNTNACGSVALKSNNIATKFDNVSVYGSPYYFVEDFNTTADWSSYKDGVALSEVSDVDYGNGAIKLKSNSELLLRSDKDSTAGWDDIEYVVKMKTTATNLKGFYFRVGVDAASAKYCINAGNTELMEQATWKSICKGESGPNINTTEPFEVRIRLTDVKTDAGKDAVRIRYTVDGTTYIDYVDDGSFVESITGVAEDKQKELAKYPLTAASHGRGFTIQCDSNLTGDNEIDSITIVDPSAGTVVATADAPTTFAANSDVEAKLTLENNGYETTKTMFITALYDDNDDIVDVKVVYPKLLPDVTDEIKTTINTKNATKMKVYVWDNWETMIPIIEPKISTLNTAE